MIVCDKTVLHVLEFSDKSRKKMAQTRRSARQRRIYSAKTKPELAP